MNEQLRQLELEVEAALARIAPRLDVHPSDACATRTRQAVRHELNERWLADQDAVEPSRFAMARTKSAVRAELARLEATSPGAALRRTADRRLRWIRAASALSAAALILFCLGVIWQAGMLKPPAPTPDPAVIALAETEVDLLVSVADQMFGNYTYDQPFVNEITAIESSIPTWESTMPEAVETFSIQVDEMLEESGGNPTARMSRLRQGAFG